jgi:hypothetical protein
MVPYYMIPSHFSHSLSPSARPSSLCARRLLRPGRGVSQFRSLPSSFNVKRSPFNFRPPQSPHQYHSTSFSRPLFSYSYALFCRAHYANSRIFKHLCTLCEKHPGWVAPRSIRSGSLYTPGIPSQASPLLTTPYPLLTSSQTRRPSMPALSSRQSLRKRQSPVDFRTRRHVALTRPHAKRVSVRAELSLFLLLTKVSQ